MENKPILPKIESDNLQWSSKLEKFALNQFFVMEEFILLLKYNKIYRFNTGECIIRQGKKMNGLYLILEGEVNVTERVLGEGIVNLETRHPGSFLGVISFIDKVSTPASFVAQETTHCLFINRTFFDVITTLYPEINYKIFKIINQQVYSHLKTIHDKVTQFIAHSDMSKLSFYGRVVHTLMQPKKLPAEEAEKNKLILQENMNYFTAEEYGELFDCCIFIDAAKNCKIVHADEKNSSCYIVIRGAVQSSIMKDNKLAKLSVIGPNTLFSSISCVNKDYSFTVSFITCEHSILLKIPEEKLKYIEQNNRNLWYKLYSLICHSMVALQKSVDKLDLRLKIENYNR